MPKEFDPYRKWLGIPPKDQPPHHYRLLGIAPFEDDPDVIENAAERQMAHVRRFQSGQRASLSQTILNELAAAKICLLDPRKKVQYDEILREKLEPTALPVAEAIAEAPPVAGELVDGPPATVEPADAMEADVDAPPAAPIPAPRLTGVPVPEPPRAVPPPQPEPPVTTDESETVETPPPESPQSPETEAQTPKAAAVPVGTVSVGPSGTKVTSRSPASRVRGRRKKSSPMPIVIIAGAGVVLLLAVISIIAANSGSPDDDDDNGRSRTTSKQNGAGRSRTKNGAGAKKDRDGRHEKKKPNGGSGKGIDKSPTKFDPPQTATAGGSLLSARTALANRDYAHARRELNDAQRLASKPAETAEVEMMDALLAYLDAFTGGVRKGAKSIKRGGTFVLNGVDVEMQDVGGDTITYRHNRDKRKVNIRDLSAKDAVALAWRGLPEDDALSKIYVATFLAVDGGGDRDGQRAAAKKLWQRAADQGHRNRALAAELNIDLAAAPLHGGDEDPPTQFDPPTSVDLSDPTDGGITKLPGGDPAAAAKRRPVPDADAQLAAKARVTQRFKHEFSKSRNDFEKRELAKLIVTEALKEKDHAVRFVLLEKARDLAVELSNPEALVRIVDEMADDFEIDSLSEKGTYLSRSVADAVTKAENADIYKMAATLFDEAMSEKRYDAASTLARVAVRAARKANEFKYVRAAEERERQVESFLTEQKKADQAAETLKENADDPAANLALGKFRCFFKDDWENGLPLLAKGSDELLKDVAAQELAKPADAAQQVELADGWLKIGRRNSDGAARENILRRARARYERAMDGLDGLERVKVNERIREIDGMLGDGGPSSL